MKKQIDDKMEEFLLNPLINKSEVARQIGITASNLGMKINNYMNYPYSKLTLDQRRRLYNLMRRLKTEIELTLEKENEEMQRRRESAK